MRSPCLEAEKLVEVREEGRFLLIGVVSPTQTRSVTEEHLQELAALLSTLGVIQTETLIVIQRQVNPATFVGRGKVEELQQYIQSNAITGVIFDDDLSPTQLRNLQRALAVTVRDRTAVILEIFALHARTREAKTQIELATLQYLLPRLSHRWGHLERQVGGINVRAGAGETQIELDRRVIKSRIAKLQEELIAIDHERRVQSQDRQNFFRIVLVGYTNVGKSTILNLLTNAQVFVADQLFATLDSTVRQWKLNGYPHVLLTDTIGFIRKLPPGLIASFRSTLSEIKEADLFIIVADASDENCFHQLAAVEEILQSIGASEKQQILVFNKIDLANGAILRRAQRTYPEAVFISAQKQLKIDDLRQAVVKKIEELQQTYTFRLSIQDGNAVALVYEFTNVLATEYLEAEIKFTVRCFPPIWHWLIHKIKSIRLESDRSLSTKMSK